MLGTSIPIDLWESLGEARELQLMQGETLTGGGVWVLTVVIAGRPWRWAAEDVEITTDDAATLRIPGGLDISPEESADVLRLDGSERSVSARDLMPIEDVSQIVELGHELDDLPAEVALWYPGRTWEERLVLLRGSTWLPSYGTRDEPIALTVESAEYEERGRLLEPNGTVSAITWPSSTKPGDKVDGRSYPLVIGRPDWVPATIYDSINDRCVLCQGDVNATSVAVVHDDPAISDVTSDPEAVTPRRDSLGRWVSTGGYSSLTITDNFEIVSRWMVGYADGGGLMSDRGSSYLTGLGEVARWAMRRSTIPIDESRWKGLEDRLNRFQIDFWTNDTKLTPWAFVRDDLLPLVPVSILHGPRGLYPVWWPYDETGGARECVAEVDANATGLERVAGPEYERDERPINEMTLEYYPWQGDLWRHRLTYTGRDLLTDETTDTYLVQTAPLRAAFSRHRGQLRAAPIVQSRAIFQRTTAEMVLGWKQYAKCRSPRVVSYDDTRGRWAWLRPGQVVTLVDDELGMDRIAWVRRRAWSVDSVRLQFLLWDHP